MRSSGVSRGPTTSVPAYRWGSSTIVPPAPASAATAASNPASEETYSTRDRIVEVWAARASAPEVRPPATATVVMHANATRRPLHRDRLPHPTLARSVYQPLVAIPTKEPKDDSSARRQADLPDR